MNAERRLDCLIVGKGLAGGLLAWRLLQRGLRIMVFDGEDGHSASLTAAGLIHPITGKRLVKTPDFETLYASAAALYRELEAASGIRFLYPLPLLRLFASVEEFHLWRQRRENDADPCYGRHLPPRSCPPGVKAPFGGFVHDRAATLDTAALLRWLGRQLAAAGVLCTELFDATGLRFSKNEIRYGDLAADHVVFCEGYQAMDNPWFRWLPFQAAKGEILTLRSRNALTDRILLKGKWLIPRADGCYKLGATYRWQPLDEEPTEEARRELLRALDEELLSGQADREVVEHRAGVRPGTRDKNPFLGRHPEAPRLLIFNGFGSKGSLTIPTCSTLLADHLIHGAALPPAFDIKRHYDAYSPDRPGP